MSEILLGGQAVLEGVMMRSPQLMTVAVRKADKTIAVHSEPIEEIPRKYAFMKKPLLRGTYALYKGLTLGFKALQFSADVAIEEENNQEEKSGRSREAADVKDEENRESGSSPALWFSLVLAIGAGILLFFMLPLYLTQLIGGYFHSVLESSILFNAVDGIIRLGLFIGYLIVISMMKDIKRLYQYHGAEHKSVFAFEAGEELTVENCRSKSTLHPRCGTGFLLTVFVISILIFSLIPKGSPFWIKAGMRIVLIPFIAGISFELIKWASSQKGSRAFSVLLLPGLWLQKITTREPSDDQLEVALTALKETLAKDHASDTQTVQPIT